MSYSTDLAIISQSLAGNQPYLSQAKPSVLMQLIETHLTQDTATQVNNANSSINLTWNTAVGNALVAHANSFGVYLSAGVAATDNVILWCSILSTAPQNIIEGTLVSTAGAGTSSPAVYFSLPTVTIPANQYMPGINIQIIQNSSGTSLGPSHVTLTPSTTQPTYSKLGIFTFTALTGSTYRLDYTPVGGTLVNIVPSLSTLVNYDSAGYIPGIQFYVAGTLNPGDSSYFGFNVTPTTVTCNQAGVIGNVTPGQIINTSIGQTLGMQVSNANSVQTPAGLVLNPTAGNRTSSTTLTMGVDPDDPVNNPIPIRAKIATVATQQGGLTGALSAILQISGVYDAYIYDPKQGSGYVYYYWISQDGTASGIAAASNTSSGSPDSTYYLASPTLTGLALQVDTAIRAYLGSLIPRIGSYSGNSTQISFVISNISTVYISYTPVIGAQFSVLEPIMTATLQAYINGGIINGVTFPGMLHNQTPQWNGMYDACKQTTGNSLANFLLTATAGGTVIQNLGSAALTTLYRCTGTLNVVYTHI